jgi:hypothetical protein
VYTGQSNSWINRKSFKQWFFHTFIPSVKEHFSKIGVPEDGEFILLLDNCNALFRKFELRSGNISVLYLPPSVMPHIQPMDQGVVQNMK